MANILVRFLKHSEKKKISRFSLHAGHLISSNDSDAFVNDGESTRMGFANNSAKKSKFETAYYLDGVYG